LKSAILSVVFLTGKMEDESGEAEKPYSTFYSFLQTRGVSTEKLEAEKVNMFSKLMNKIEINRVYPLSYYF